MLSFQKITDNWTISVPKKSLAMIWVGLNFFPWLEIEDHSNCICGFLLIMIDSGLISTQFSLQKCIILHPLKPAEVLFTLFFKRERFQMTCHCWTIDLDYILSKYLSITSFNQMIEKPTYNFGHIMFLILIFFLTICVCLYTYCITHVSNTWFKILIHIML